MARDPRSAPTMAATTYMCASIADGSDVLSETIATPALHDDGVLAQDTVRRERSGNRDAPARVDTVSAQETHSTDSGPVRRVADVSEHKAVTWDYPRCDTTCSAMHTGTSVS